MKSVAVRMQALSGTVIAGLGMGVALYLVCLKYVALPCVGSGCGEVIGSRYGEVLGVPVGFGAVALWLGVLLGRERTRLVCALLLAVGSLYFTAIQVWVLHAFCPWCLAHAILTWVALGFLRRPMRVRLALLLGGMLSAILLGVSWWRVLPANVRDAQTLEVMDETLGFNWLGSGGGRSAWLVISLDCPSCIDLLADLTATPPSASWRTRPAILLKTEEHTRGLSQVYAGAIRAAGGDFDAFQLVTTLLLQERELLLGNPEGAASWLRSMFPSDGDPLEAEKLARQNAVLQAAGIRASPVLVWRNGRVEALRGREDMEQALANR